jgi:hypothetical protein
MFYLLHLYLMVSPGAGTIVRNVTGVAGAGAVSDAALTPPI